MPRQAKDPFLPEPWGTLTKALFCYSKYLNQAPESLRDASMLWHTKKKIHFAVFRTEHFFLL
jgi:hypothetical protein